MTSTEVKNTLAKLANSKVAEQFKRFFKTGPGDYSEGDQFIGIKVPDLRKVAKQFKNLSLEAISHLLSSPIHEERMVALMILCLKVEKADQKMIKEIGEFYLAHLNSINNWDLVDGSAPFILGPFVTHYGADILNQLAISSNLWHRRIAMLTCFYDIKRGQFGQSITIAEILLQDTHDLIHKAVGWMLREIGKRSLKDLEDFLSKHGATMPRTMLRYAIERLSEDKKKYYMALKYGATKELNKSLP